MNGQILIETQGLSKAYGKLVAVDSVGLLVGSGSAHGLIGPNGAGKSTLLRMLVGATRPSKGSGTIKEFALGSLEARRIIGYSMERPSFYEDMTAWDYLVYMATLSGLHVRKAQARADELLDWLELGSFWRAEIRGFSAGMKQRLSLAQAMMHSPELLILDEPTANLDPTGRLKILKKLKQLPVEYAVTILISSHILSELEYLVDYVTIMDGGRIIFQGDYRFGICRTVHRFVLNTSDNVSVAAILSAEGSAEKVSIEDDAAIHLIGQDASSMQDAVLHAVNECRARVFLFGEEDSRLEYIYRTRVVEDIGGT